MSKWGNLVNYLLAKHVCCRGGEWRRALFTNDYMVESGKQSALMAWREQFTKRCKKDIFQIFTTIQDYSVD